MKKILLSLVAAATLSFSSFGQAPEGFKYQAIIRDAGNTILNNQAVGLRMTIQQGSIGGTTVYAETFAAITNAYGLVNLEIGNGAVLTGAFTTIDWVNGPYFMETAADITGGTNYAVMGTSQLMSVPFALYAKTSGNGQGPVGPQGNQGPAGVDGVDGSTGLQGPAGADGQGGVTTAGSGINVTGAGTAASPYVVSTTSPCGLAIGQTYQDGIIFYLDASGCHGLISAPTDQSTGIQWYNGINTVTNAVRDGLGAGKFNTERIIANQGAGNYAAQLCANYQGGNSGDWYLPSNYELNLMYLNIGQGNALGLGNVGGFSDNPYWSSAEIGINYAWIQDFNGGLQYNDYPKWSANYVRAIRAF